MKKKILFICISLAAVLAVITAVILIRFNSSGVHSILGKFYHVKTEMPCIVAIPEDDSFQYVETVMKIDVKYTRPWRITSSDGKYRGDFVIEGLFEDKIDKGTVVSYEDGNQLSIIHYFDEWDSFYTCVVYVKSKEAADLIGIINGDKHYFAWIAPTIEEARAKANRQ